MIAWSRILKLLIVLSLAIICGGARVLAAQDSVEKSGWPLPHAISLNVPGRAYQVRIAADMVGNVHAVWQQDTDEDGIFESIFYAFWNPESEQWSMPMDILYATTGAIGPLSLVVHPSGYLILLYTANNNLYLGTAPVTAAKSAQSWHSMMAVPDAIDGYLMIDGQGNVGLVYVSGNRDILYQESSTLGATWTDPLRIYWIDTPQEALGAPFVTKSADDILHFTWQENAQRLDWNPIRIGYVRVVGGAQDIQSLKRIENEGSFPSIYVAPDGILYWFWDRGIGHQDGRYEAVSYDNGTQWSASQAILNGLSGRSGWSFSVWDTNGVHHHITSGGGLGREGGIYYCQLEKNTGCDPPLLLSTGLPFSEGPTVALSRGGQIHVAWYDHSDGKVYHTYKTVAELTPERPSPPTMTPEQRRIPQPRPQDTSIPDAGYSDSSEARPTPSVLSAEPPPYQSSDLWPLLLALVLSGVLVAAVVVWRIRQKKF